MSIFFLEKLDERIFFIKVEVDKLVLIYGKILICFFFFYKYLLIIDKLFQTRS